MITIEKFGQTFDGEEVLVFTLTDGKGSVKILNLGGTLQSIVLPDKKGNLTDILLGYNCVADYEKNDGYLGALIGRFGNRIGAGKLCIDGKEYALYCNDKGNHLHGGKRGFDKKIWKHEIIGEKLILSILSPDGEENYPGNLTVKVTYTFIDGELKIDYYAISDKKTAVSLTNHAYFNLNGEKDGSILDQTLWLNGDFITPTDDKLIPTGDFKEVKGTPFDFNQSKAIGKDIEEKDDDLKKGSGYDHCYLLKNEGAYGKYAVVYSQKTGIKMSCYTDMPAVHFYAGNFLNQAGKTRFYPKRAGFCLETEAIPNNVNVPAYAKISNSIIDAGQEYAFSAAFRFEIC